MTSSLSAPSMPRVSMFDGVGPMSREWQNFFRDLFIRVGSSEAMTNTELEGLSGAGSEGVYSPSSPNRFDTKRELLVGEYAQPQPKNLSYLIEKIERLLYTINPKTAGGNNNLLLQYFLQEREPFKFYLPQTTWEDLRFPVQSVKVSSTFPPTFTAYKGGYVLAFDTGPNSESIYWVAQIPHARKDGSDIYPHIHWTIKTSGAGIGAENVKWDFTHSWANIGGSFPAATSDTLTVDVQSRVADIHYLDDLTQMSGSGKGISSIVICSLERDVSVANDYTDDAYFLEFDFHIEQDATGSRKEGFK